MKSKLLVISLIIAGLLLFSCSDSTKPKGTVATPTFSPSGGTYSSGRMITISCETEEVKIYYTTDGSSPTESSVLYSEPFMIESDTILRARAYKRGWNESEIAEAEYIITGFLAAPLFDPPAGLYTSPQDVVITSDEEGATIRYTTDGTDPHENSTEYSLPVAIESDTVLMAKAFKEGWEPSETATAEYIITGTVATPLFNPPAGIYTTPQLVSIVCPEGRGDRSEIIIRFTKDGSNPDTTSMIYTEPLKIDSDTLLKARGFKTDWEPSEISSAEYTITGTLQRPFLSPPGGTYTMPQTVSIISPDSGTEIRYTTDGTFPDENSILYTSPIEIESAMTLRARAFKENWISSSAVTDQYAFIELIPGEMVYVVGGSFTPAPNYSVTLSSFYIGRYEVTQEEYLAVMGDNPSYFNSNLKKPVEQVSWFDAIEYCNRLSMSEGYNPCYSYTAEGVNYGTNPDDWPNGWNQSAANHINVSCDWSQDGYRLPTEMEREFAARGGVIAQNSGTFHHSWAGTNDESRLIYYAWYAVNNTPWGSKQVGAKLPNELGLYDMSGNVWNWVWDIWGHYPTGSHTDPTGSTAGSSRIWRGGNWGYTASFCTVSHRASSSPVYSSSGIGFRLCRRTP